MIQIALRSVRQRTSQYAAAFLTLLLGATVVMSFASFLDTAIGQDLTSTDQTTLVTLASVVGGWGLVIVVVAVAATLTLTVRQRSSEMALLKCVGATPRQLRRMITGEAVMIAGLATATAIVPSLLIGRVIFDLVQDGGQVADSVDHRFGSIALGAGFAITVGGAALAARLAARRVTKMAARDAVMAAAVDTQRLSWTRRIGAFLFLAGGIQSAVMTMTVLKDEGSDTMRNAGQASITFAVGLALLAPWLARVGTAVLGGVLQRLGGTAGYLTAHNLRRRSHQLSGALMPIILFTAIATGTVYMQLIENHSLGDAVKSVDDKNIETVNFVLVGMLALFAAIMLVNTLLSATTYRRREFAQQRLVGATPSEVLGMVRMESVALVVIGVLCGTFAALLTVIPFSFARTDQLVPDENLLIWLGIVGVATVLTLAASVNAARRTMRGPAVEAIAA